MISLEYIVIVSAFIIYYLIVLLVEKRFIREPSEIITKFLAVLLLFAGVSLIYYSFTGKPFLTDSDQNYSLYIFIIGFIAIIWTIPELLSEFKIFKKYTKKGKK